MQRRQWLKVGIAAAALLTVAGAGAAWWLAGARARVDERFEPATRQLFLAVGAAVLQGSLPEEQGARDQALLHWIERLQTTVAGMPAAVQKEVDEMVLILTSPPGRRALVGLHPPWDQATPHQLQAALQGMRLSTLSLRQQIFHALRDLSNAAFFAAPESWAAIGYPGPLKV